MIKSILFIIFTGMTTVSLAATKSYIPVYNVPGTSEKMVEVTCNGMTYFAKKQAPGLFIADIQVTEAWGFKANVFTESFKNTLQLSVWQDEAEGVELNTFGTDLSFKKGNLELSCIVNTGEQISDL